MQFEYDPEKLIEEVKKRPGIWDSDNVQYRGKEIKHKLWNEIVRELLQGDVELTKSEMRELELQLQKKWKSIRDCFTKYVQNPNRQRRPYVYSNNLQFLLKNKATSEKEASSGSDDEKEKNKRSIWRSKKTVKLVKPEEQSSDDEDDNDQEEYITYSNDAEEYESPAKIPRTCKSENNFAFASVDRHEKVDGEDADKMFLISLLPHLKSIPEEYRLNAKMDLMQVLRNANYSAVTDNTLTVTI